MASKERTQAQVRRDNVMGYGAAIGITGAVIGLFTGLGGWFILTAVGIIMFAVAYLKDA